MPLFRHFALHLQSAQCALGALYVEGLTGDYREARIMVTLFAEPRWKNQTRVEDLFFFPKADGGGGVGWGDSSKVHCLWR